MYKNLPSLKSLLAFSVATKSENFSQAADNLFITQSAVSHQIKNLEKALGFELFYREGKQLKLTANGNKLAQVVNQSLSNIETTIEEITGQTNHIVHFGVSSSFAIHRLVPRLGELLEQLPMLDIRLKMISCHDPLTELDLDIILHDNPISHVAYQCQQIKQERYFPVANATLAQQLGTTPIEHWPDHTKLIDIQGFNTWQEWYQLANVVTEPLNVQYFSHNILVMKSILAGHGIALMGEALIKDELERGELIKLSAQAMTFDDEGFYFSCHKRREKDANIRKIHQWLIGLIN
ncbi:LysR substrate-binding domain-containing protein [Thalassotalea ganghwensis]